MVGLLLEGHPHKDPQIYRDSHLRLEGTSWRKWSGSSSEKNKKPDFGKARPADSVSQEVPED